MALAHSDQPAAKILDIFPLLVFSTRWVYRDNLDLDGFHYGQLPAAVFPLAVIHPHKIPAAATVALAGALSGVEMALWPLGQILALGCDKSRS